MITLDHLEYTVVERFLQYVTIDTQSDPQSGTFPSTEKQKNLGRILVSELLDIGLDDAHLDDFGFVYATLPSNSTKDVPTICLCSHMDTSPDCSGFEVKPIVHKNYQGEVLMLPLDNAQILSPSINSELKNQIGNDIITASGDTLLGADNKAGVAEIMDAIFQLTKNPHIKHGTIQLLFTPDEEIGMGVNNVNMEKLNAQYGYTVDGETLGNVEDENFYAKSATINITGVPTHPGFAIGKMENAIKIQQAILQALPIHTLSPETTEGKEPFIHPTFVSGTLDESKLVFILRSFTSEEMDRLEDILSAICNRVSQIFSNSIIKLEFLKQYDNMKQILDMNPQVVQYALEAVKRAGIEPKLQAIRGGTDGSRLSFMGLPCPNIFAGEHNFHSKIEWVSVQDMQHAVNTLIHLVNIWEENS